MTAWYFDLALLRDERAALESLAMRAEWFRPLNWRMDNQGRLTFEADIVLPTIVRPVTLQYPNHFPKAPPLVLPRGDLTRWSAHQWGAGGELCLEYRADNWHEGITGADMLESAHRLLEGELPDSASGGVVPNAHATSEGQRMRDKRIRFFPTRHLQQFLATVALGQVLKAEIIMAYHDKLLIQFVHEVSNGPDVVWTDPEISRQLACETIALTGDLLRLPDGVALPSTDSIAALDSDLASHGLVRTSERMVLVRGETSYYYKVYEDGSVHRAATMETPPERRRLDESHASLRAKKVALIGCGSLGSKVATMLARAGVGGFLLVDDDILYPGNLVRHDLDWRDMVMHKADALARRIQLVNAAAKTAVRRMRLGGQEAASSVNGLIELFSDYDLIIDATADPVVFNYLAAVPGKPLVWGEVFGGGFGGLIARYRPGVEPPIQQMRQEIEVWFAEHAEGKPRLDAGYGAERDGVTWIADDADATVIAAHLARFAIDLLIGRSPSLFPHSVYAVGMAHGSVFDQPFDTRPILLSAAHPEVPRAILSEQETQEQIALISDVLERFADEINSASKDDTQA